MHTIDSIKERFKEQREVKWILREDNHRFF